MTDLYDYSRWQNFSKSELVCQETGLENPNVAEFIELMDAVQEMRNYFGVPFGVNSAYRSPNHSIEAKKVKGGQHTLAAIDLVIPTVYAYDFVQEAFKRGFTGIGINLTGEHRNRFIHVDFRKSSPRIWSY